MNWVLAIALWCPATPPYKMPTLYESGGYSTKQECEKAKASTVSFSVVSSSCPAGARVLGVECVLREAAKGE
jgi:hypothetical protein